MRSLAERIVDSVVRADELDGWVLGWVPPSRSGLALRLRHDLPLEPTTDEDELWFYLVGQDDPFATCLWMPDGWGLDVDQCLESLAGQLEDFTAESVFAWGQQRTAWRPGDAT